MNITQTVRIRPKIGDIIEIATPRGLAYAQFTHKHPTYGALLRVFPGFYETRPTDFTDIVNQQPQFVMFFPLGAACNQKVVLIADNQPIPKHGQEFPLFRSRIKSKHGCGPWWLWDGEKEWKIGTLEPGMENYPIRGVWNDTLLITRIVQGWRHQDDI